MSDDKDDLNGFDGLGKTNDDGMHFSEEELEAAMAGFEKEFQDEPIISVSAKKILPMVFCSIPIMD